MNDRQNMPLAEKKTLESRSEFDSDATSASSADQGHLANPESIGPYHLLSPLGQGGMGQVWLAQQFSPVKRQVALKLIKSGRSNEAIVRRFEIERQSIAMMNHPFIAKVFDAGVAADGQPYFAMEYVPGLAITDYCNQKHLSPRERIELFLKVCQGVQHAHQKGIMHRDLKPSNILVSDTDGAAVPRIIDFGIAKALQTAASGSEETSFTEAGIMIGTRGYMSPEQADPGVLDVDTRTDVYSLGVVLYELLTGSLPIDPAQWREKPLREVLRQLHEEDPKRPSARVSTDAGSTAAANCATEPGKLIRQLRGDLDWITMKALDRDRERRYASPADLAADLGRYLSNEPVIARPPSVLYRTGKFVRRNRLAVSLSGVIGLLVVGFAATMTVERDRANRAAETATRVADFMTGMFSVSDPSEARGNTVTARELLDKAAAGIEKGLSKDERVQARLMQTMAKTYIGLGLFSEARGLLERTVAIQTRLFGANAAETLQSMSLLGHADEVTGRYPEAEKLLRQALAGQQRLLGSHNAETMATMGRLSDTLSLAGDYAAAEPFVRATLQSQQRILGPESRAAMRSMRTLTGNLTNQRRYADAEKVGRETLALEQRVSGPNDPGTLWSMNILGNILDQEHKYPEAEKLLRETLATENRVLGPEHASTQVTLTTLGSVVSDEGRLAEAEGLQRTALEGAIKTNGAQGPTTLFVMGYLATTLQKEEKFPEAVKLSRQILDAYSTTLGPDAPLTSDAMLKLAVMLAYAKQPVEAELMFQKAIASVAKTEPDQLGAALYSYGAGMALLGKPDEALPHLQQAVAHGFADADQMSADDDLKPLRGDPRFQALLAQMRKAHVAAR